MLEKAKARGYSETVMHDLEKYPYPEGIGRNHFHAIVCVGVMDFIKHPFEFLDFNRKFLIGSGGIVGITLPEHHQWSDLSSFTDHDMSRLFERLGWKILKKQRFLGYIDSVSGRQQYYYGFLLEL
jgi:hypothetical protein